MNAQRGVALRRGRSVHSIQAGFTRQRYTPDADHSSDVCCSGIRQWEAIGKTTEGGDGVGYTVGVGKRSVYDLTKPSGGGEDDIIRVFSSLGHPVGQDVVVPNGDDAAVIQSPQPQLSVVTTDTLVEDVHFSWKYTSFEEVGRKLVAVNLSDVAAMGARPRYILLSFVFPTHVAEEKLHALALGIHAECVQHEIGVIGGNVSQGKGPMVLTATALGEVDKGRVLRRTGAARGDGIYVSGSLGDAKGWLHWVFSETQEGTAPTQLRKALVCPSARIALGQALAGTRVVTAMCDVSDGLGRDVRYLLADEQLGAEIWGHRLPVSEELQRYCDAKGLDAPAFVAEGGEDYELLFTAPQHATSALYELGQRMQTPIHHIGRVLGGHDFYLTTAEGKQQPLPDGYTHF